MRMRKNRKALSPVVASIILIAVTVAVSIAVAAWMGALTFNFMGTEELHITGATFPSTSTASLVLQNTGTTPITVSEIHVNNGANLLPSAVTLPANNQTTVTITFTWTPGYNYQFAVRTQKGNQFTYNAIAPS